MSKLAVLWRLLSRWYISSVLLAGVGVLIGFIILVSFFPGKPQIGIIDIPGTVITNRTAFTIGEMLDFVGREDNIKAVVIRMNSPGGGAAASEQLFLKTLELRGRKPVVVVSQDINASGGYMWSMGANFIYTKPTSFVGSVGVVGQLRSPPRPDEDIVFSGPSKRTGAPRRAMLREIELIKESFLDIVESQRGDRLQITRDELSEARLYPGLEAVQLGLADAIGSDTDAIKKAAGLAGISDYDLVDVNAEVLRLLVEKFKKIFGSSPVGDGPGTLAQIDDLSKLLSSSVISNLEEGDILGLPGGLEIPQFYFLYVPPFE